jgi:hypothetical protein
MLAPWVCSIALVKTALDYWILKNFVFRYSVLCNTVPNALPLDTQIDAAGHGRWAYRLFCGDEDSFRAVTTLLSSTSSAFKSDIQIRDTPSAKFLAGAVKDSLVLKVAWWLLVSCLSGGVALVLAKAHVAAVILKRFRLSLGFVQAALPV